MGIGRYITPENIRLALAGLAAGVSVGVARIAIGRGPWGPVPFAVAVLVAARLTDRSDWPHWFAMVGVGVVLAVLTATGTALLLAEPAVPWLWVAAGGLVSVFAIWAGVPETGPAVLVGGALLGLTAIALLAGARWGPAAGAGLAAVLTWAALSGAVQRPWAAVGGALCAGIAPWFALRPILPNVGRSLRYRAWLFGVHTALALVAARWIAVVPNAGWVRVALVAVTGLAVATLVGRRA